MVFCPRAGLSLQTQHAPVYLFSPFLFVPSYSPFIIMLSIIWYLLLLPRTFFPFTITSRASFSRQFLLSQYPSQFIFLFLISSSIILPPPLFQAKLYFLFFLHTHISNASSCFCSFRLSVQVSAPYNTTLHTKHFTNLFRSSFPKSLQKMLLFLLKASFAIAILYFTSWQHLFIPGGWNFKLFMKDLAVILTEKIYIIKRSYLFTEITNQKISVLKHSQRFHKKTCNYFSPLL